MIRPAFAKNFEGWRAVARQLIAAGAAPNDVAWQTDEQESLFSSQALGSNGNPESDGSVRAPAEFVSLAEDVACARDDDRWALLYRILFRIKRENAYLLKITVDPDVSRALHLQRSVRRDVHKMHAFVRFKKVKEGAPGEIERYVAWHRPQHLICAAAAPFFVRRFGDREWTIFTPDASAHWNLERLSMGPGMAQVEFNARDDWDVVWRTYYGAIFNPSRVKMKAMRAEMAPRYWSTLPEAQDIAGLVRDAPRRAQEMQATQRRNAQSPVLVDAAASLQRLREEAQRCTACPLYERATQTVFGEGPERAPLMIVGEQPGDGEDRAGRPFVGPAGQELNAALLAAGLAREAIYLTNAVKHFKWKEADGERPQKRRLHQKPSGAEMHACKPWLEGEIARVKPKLILALGATAATAVLGRLPKIKSERGKIQVASGQETMISWHPSAILRAFDVASAAQMRAELIADLRAARAWIDGKVSFADF